MTNFSFFPEKRVFDFQESLYESLFSINNLELNTSYLNVFLKIGYVPSNLTLFNNVKLINSFSDIEPLESVFLSLPEYSHDISTLKDLMLNSIAERYESTAIQVVPLSGGMDSRIVLASLCEFTEAKNIHTYTFGVPGSYDYEIPNKIAKKLGTKHTNFNSEQTNYTIDGLITAALASDGNTEVFHPLVLNRVSHLYGSEANYWSGLGGDFTGGGLSASKLAGGTTPKERLINYEKRGIHFLDDIIDDKLLHPYITISGNMHGCISDSEAYFWENHHQRYTRHHILRNDMNIKAPLVDTRILKFFFTLPKSQRENKKFFNESFASIYPKIFDIPTKDYGYKYSRYFYKQPFRKARFYTKASGWRLAPKLITHPHTAYIDMQHAINERPDVKNCIDELLSDLSHRNIIDNKRMFKFLSQHREGSKNYTKDIINLASLEVILKAANL